MARHSSPGPLQETGVARIEMETATSCTKPSIINKTLVHKITRQVFVPSPKLYNIDPAIS